MTEKKPSVKQSKLDEQNFDPLKEIVAPLNKWTITASETNKLSEKSFNKLYEEMRKQNESTTQLVKIIKGQELGISKGKAVYNKVEGENGFTASGGYLKDFLKDKSLGFTNMFKAENLLPNLIKGGAFGLTKLGLGGLLGAAKIIDTTNEYQSYRKERKTKRDDDLLVAMDSFVREEGHSTKELTAQMKKAGMATSEITRVMGLYQKLINDKVIEVTRFITSKEGSKKDVMEALRAFGLAGPSGKAPGEGADLTSKWFQSENARGLEDLWGLGLRGSRANVSGIRLKDYMPESLIEQKITKKGNEESKVGGSFSMNEYYEKRYKAEASGAINPKDFIFTHDTQLDETNKYLKDLTVTTKTENRDKKLRKYNKVKEKTDGILSGIMDMIPGMGKMKGLTGLLSGAAGGASMSLLLPIVGIVVSAVGAYMISSKYLNWGEKLYDKTHSNKGLTDFQKQMAAKYGYIGDNEEELNVFIREKGKASVNAPESRKLKESIDEKRKSNIQREEETKKEAAKTAKENHETLVKSLMDQRTQQVVTGTEKKLDFIPSKSDDLPTNLYTKGGSR